jgi:hypothetical protein
MVGLTAVDAGAGDGCITGATGVAIFGTETGAAG